MGMDTSFVAPVATDYVHAEAIRCRNDNLVIAFCAAKETTDSGLVALPRADYAREIDGRLAEVLAVGPGPAYGSKCASCGSPKTPFDMAVRPGAKVIVDGKLCGELVFINGRECRIVRQAEILAVVEED